jgi:hypothetical protein
MKITANALSSLRFTTALLSILTLWFMSFPILVKTCGRGKLVQALNRTLFIDWFVNESSQPLLQIWFIGLGLLMGLLALNLTICTWRRFRPQPDLSRQKWLLFFIHLLFGLLLVSHGAGFFRGWRPAPIRAFSGEVINFDQGYQMTIEQVMFHDNPQILEKPRQQWNRDDFNFSLNRAQVTLRHNGVEIIKGEISTYNPLQRGALQITLLGFVPPAAGTKIPGIRLQVSRAPFAHAVIWLFHAMIVMTFIYILTTVKTGKETGRENGTETK